MGGINGDVWIAWTSNFGHASGHEPGRSFWERWRLAGGFRFSVPDWPAGRRRSQEGHGKGTVAPVRGYRLPVLKTDCPIPSNTSASFLRMTFSTDNLLTY